VEDSWQHGKKLWGGGSEMRIWRIDPKTSERIATRKFNLMSDDNEEMQPIRIMEEQRSKAH